MLPKRDNTEALKRAHEALKAKREAGGPKLRKASRAEHTVRTADNDFVRIPRLTRGLAIRMHCTECLGWQGNAKEDCTDELCCLFPFRGRSLRAYRGTEALTNTTTAEPEENEDALEEDAEEGDEPDDEADANDEAA